MKWIAAVAGLTLIVGLTGLFWWSLPATERPGARTLLAMLDRPSIETDAPTAFEVHEGEWATSIGRRLEEAGLLRSAWLFRAWATTLGVDARLEAGQYEIPGGLTAQELVARFDRAQAPYRRVTVVEGWRMEEIAEELERQGIVSKEPFLAAAREGGSLLPEKPASAEGYLFPDTYFFPLTPVEPAELVSRLVATFFDRFTQEMRIEAAAKRMSLHSVVTLASIVEREARMPEEQPHIAGVLLNRLDAEMRLEADPTVQYAVAARPDQVAAFGYWKTELTLADLETDSPYNTYLWTRLPPGPIANPGLDALLAVVRPQETRDLFFAARPDGSHAFAATLEEHLRNIRLYRP